MTNTDINPPIPPNEHNQDFNRDFDGVAPRGGAGTGSGVVLPTSTLGAMVFRIAAELGARFDLGGVIGSASNSTPNSEAIRNAINTAIGDYQKQRFRFSEIDPSNPLTFSTVPGQFTYSTADNPQISSMYIIDYINIQIGNTLMQLGQVNPEQQHLNIQLFTQFGLPTSFAYEGNTVILYPIPAAAYTLYLGAHLFMPGPASDTDTTSVWMNPTQGERLVRCRAKYEVATHVTRNRDMAALMSPYPDGNNGTPGETYRAFAALKAETNKITSTRSRVKPMAF